MIALLFIQIELFPCILTLLKYNGRRKTFLNPHTCYNQKIGFQAKPCLYLHKKQKRGTRKEILYL